MVYLSQLPYLLMPDVQDLSLLIIFSLLVRSFFWELLPFSRSAGTELKRSIDFGWVFEILTQYSLTVDNFELSP